MQIVANTAYDRRCDLEGLLLDAAFKTGTVYEYVVPQEHKEFENLLFDAVFESEFCYWQKKTEHLTEACRRASILTAEDYAVTINYKI